jgi:Fur family ferric uptake transcriptional regulator
MGGHRSADEIAAQLERQDEPLPRMSVYNAVAALLGAGLLMRADAGPGRTLYEAGEAWHHHFVCRRCRRVFDVPCVRGRKPCLSMPSRVGRPDEAQVIFRGVCARCARR